MIGGPLRLGVGRVAIVVAAVLAPLLWASAAPAHGTLDRSEPGNGGVVAVGRSTLTLWFSERVSAGASTFDLHTLDGARMPITVRAPGTGGQGVIEIGTEPLARGTYALDWAVLSLDDGHPTRGSLVFGAGIRPAVVPAGAGDLPATPGFLLRWLDLSAIMLAIGAVAVAGRVLAPMGAAGSAAPWRARTIGAVAASVAVVSGALTPYLRTPRGGSSLGVWLDATRATLADTDWGHLWLAREVALLVAALALWYWVARRNASGGGVHVAVVALAAAVGLEAWAGHASALPRESVLAAFASGLHLVAAGVWAGGLVVMAACLLPTMRGNPGRGPIVASAWRAFSPMAAVSTVVLLATGLYESGRHLPDLHSVASTVYGGAVAAKVALVTLALILAALNTLLVNPRLPARAGPILGRPARWLQVAPHRFALVVAAEVVVLVAAVAAGALLTSVPTARDVEAAARPTAPHVATVDRIFATFEDVPIGAYRSRLIVRTRWLVKPEPAAITGVDVLLAGPAGTTASVALDEIEPGRYEGETTRLIAGAWRASVLVRRDRLPDAAARVDWTVAGATRDRASPLEFAATSLAVLLLAALAATVGLARLGRKRRPETIPLATEETVGQR